METSAPSKQTKKIRLIRKRLAIIGAIDSSGGAGINQDIRVASRFGFQPEICLTATTLQDEQGVSAIYPIPPSEFEQNLIHLFKNQQLRYIKIGALCSVSQILCLTRYLTQYPQLSIVLDPVIKPSLGTSFIQEKDIISLKELLSTCDYVTPNLPELEQLCGIEVTSFQEAVLAAQSLNRQYGVDVLLKGGHGERFGNLEAYICAERLNVSAFTRRSWNYMHGTGCAFATAFCCLIAQDWSPEVAFTSASNWVREFFDELNY